MNVFFRLITLIAVLSTSADCAVEYIGLASELRLPLPDHWIAPSDTAEYPFRIAHQTISAELLLFRSDVDENELIESDQSLEVAVQAIVDDVIMTLPAARLLTSTGYYYGDRCGFTLEFLSVDSSARVELRHRLAGIIYRQSDRGQFLFTLWGKAPIDQFAFVDNDLKLMQREFRYFGNHTTDVYSSNRSNYLIPLAVAAFLFVMVIVIRRKLTKTRLSSPTVTNQGAFSSSSIKTPPVDWG